MHEYDECAGGDDAKIRGWQGKGATTTIRAKLVNHYIQPSVSAKTLKSPKKLTAA